MDTETPTRRQLVAQFVPRSPLVRTLGMELTLLEPDVCELTLPYREANTTMADVVHGGAIASLVDTAAMVAAWAADEPATNAAGATVSMSVDYVSAARACDVVARAEVVRRGGRLCFVEVTARAGASGDVVAKGLVTHRFG